MSRFMNTAVNVHVVSRSSKSSSSQSKELIVHGSRPSSLSLFTPSKLYRHALEDGAMWVFMKLAESNPEISHHVVKSVPGAASVKVVSPKSSLPRLALENGTTRNIKEYNNGNHEISHHVVRFIPWSCQCKGYGSEIILTPSCTWERNCIY